MRLYFGFNPEHVLPGLLTRTLWDLCTIPAFRVSADDEPAMPSLYFCQPHAQNQGMLRAIVSLDDCRYLAARDQMIYVGEQFPKVYEGSSQSADFAVLSVDASEVQGEWQAGYYRLEADLMELNQHLLTLAL